MPLVCTPRRQVTWLKTPNLELRNFASVRVLPTLAQEMPRDVIYHAGQPIVVSRPRGRSRTRDKSSLENRILSRLLPHSSLYPIITIT